MSVDGSQVRKSHFRGSSKQIYDLSLVLVKMRCISDEEPQKKKRGLIILTVFGNESLSWNSGEFGIYNLAMSTGVSQAPRTSTLVSLGELHPTAS